MLLHGFLLLHTFSPSAVPCVDGPASIESHLHFITFDLSSWTQINVLQHLLPKFTISKYVQILRHEYLILRQLTWPSRNWKLSWNSVVLTHAHACIAHIKTGILSVQWWIGTFQSCMCENLGSANHSSVRDATYSLNYLSELWTKYSKQNEPLQAYHKESNLETKPLITLIQWLFTEASKVQPCKQKPSHAAIIELKIRVWSCCSDMTDEVRYVFSFKNIYLFLPNFKSTEIDLSHIFPFQTKTNVSHTKKENSNYMG